MNNNSVIDNADSVIPASQRPDGTWRKARRVKEGYVPQEEVPLYESKGKQYTSKSNKPESITLPSGQIAHRPIPGLYIVEEKEKKPNKKKSKNKSEGISIKLESSNKTLSSLPNSNVKVKKEENDIEVAPTLPEKKIKNLKKRLREIESLEEKLKNCTIAKPEPDQLMKIQRKNDLILQIYQLEKLLE